MMWLYLAILSTALFSVTNIMDKYVLTEFIRRPMFNTAVSGLVTFLGALLIPVFAAVSLPDMGLLAVCLAAGALFMAANYFFFRGVLSEEISRAMPVVLAAAPVFVLFIAALFLGEVLLPGQYAGIAVLLFSSILISAERTTKIRMNACFWLMLVSALLYATERVMMKHLLGFMDFWNVFFWVGAGAMLTVSGILVFYHGTFLRTLVELRRPSIYASMSEAISTAATFIFTVAMSFGMVSLVQSVEYTQPAIVLALATLLSIYRPRIIREELKSSVLAVKLAAIGIMVVGMFLIA